MMEDYISFEVAKLAKECGFKPVKPTTDYVYGFIEEYDNDDVPIGYHECEIQEEDWCRFDHYIRPTESQLLRWLREVHEINVWVEKYPDHPLYFPQCPKLNLSNGIGLFQKYDNALEAILLLTLKSIKNDN